MQPPIAEAAGAPGRSPSCAGEDWHHQAGSSGISWSCGSSRSLYRPAVRSSRMALADGRQLSASRRASPLLSQEVLQRCVFQHGIGQQPLPPRVLASSVSAALASETSIPPNLAFHLQMLASLTPCLRHADRNAGLVLIQDPDDLLFRNRIALLVLVLAQSELQTGLSPSGRSAELYYLAIIALFPANLEAMPHCGERLRD
jgi:hypothetical protein